MALLAIKEDSRAFIEVAYNVNSDLPHVSISKLTECLLYALYELRDEKARGEDGTRPILAALTDSCHWHIFEVSLTRRNDLKLHTFSYKLLDLNNVDTVNEYLTSIGNLCFKNTDE